MNSAQACETYASLGVWRPPRSCARKASGGDATGASSRTISSPLARRSSTVSVLAHIEPARMTPAARVGTDGTLAYPKESEPMLDLGS